MLSRLHLPPGFSIRIDYDPDQGPMDATVTVFRGGAWVGEITVPAARLEKPDAAQEIVDQLTKRGVRAVKEG